MANDTLIHYGVLGMKWGVRRTPVQLARAAGRPIKKTPPKEKAVPPPEKQSVSSTSASPKKSLSDLSDDELRQRISRLELEKRYKDLEKADAKPKSTRGRDFCVNVLETIGKNTLTNIGTQAANHILGEAINKLAGVSSDDKAHRVVNPQKGQEDKK